jgi:hypothetical protein
MGSIHNIRVIRQCLDYFSDEDIRFPISDYRVHKLTTLTCAKLLVASQLAHWGSHRQIARELRTSPVLQESLGLSHISYSQISRRLNGMPTELLEQMFLDTIGKAKSKTPMACSKRGPLRIIDSTCLKMPASLASWAYVSAKATQIKIHMRLLVLPKGEMVPEQAIPSTGNVADSEVMDLLVQDDGTVYVMDRGYVKYKQFDVWLGNGVRFVNRIQDKHGVWRVEEECPIPPGTNIVRDAIIQLGSAFTQTQKTLRLVEYRDDEGRLYRLVTSCYEWSAQEIADIYHQRWLIELYFKWMKQHLRLVKLYSYDPQGVWNQIFIALIAYAIALYVQVTSGTSQSLWDVLQSIRSCWYKPWATLEEELHLKPARTSKGRQKVPRVTKEPPQLKVSVGIIKPKKSQSSK